MFVGVCQVWIQMRLAVLHIWNSRLKKSSVCWCLPSMDSNAIGCAAYLEFATQEE